MTSRNDFVRRPARGLLAWIPARVSARRNFMIAKDPHGHRALSHISGWRRRGNGWAAAGFSRRGVLAAGGAPGRPAVSNRPDPREPRRVSVAGARVVVSSGGAGAGAVAA